MIVFEVASMPFVPCIAADLHLFSFDLWIESAACLSLNVLQIHHSLSPQASLDHVSSLRWVLYQDMSLLLSLKHPAL